jgi:uncharacterized protein YaiE (UPF0345 family)
MAATALPQDLSIPLKTKYIKGAEHIIGNSGDHPRGIKIFDAQQPLPTALPGKQITAEGRYQGAKVLAGDVEVSIGESAVCKAYKGGEAFEVPAHSSFTITVKTVMDYCCSFLG